MLEEFWIQVQEFMLTVYRAFQEMTPVKRVLILFFIIAIIPGYFLSRTLSRLYWQHYYHRYDVTAKPSFSNPQPISQGSVAILTTGSNVYNAYVKISNKNLDLSAPIVPYEFVFYNAKKEKVYSITGTTYVLPNQEKYVVVPRFTTTETVSSGQFSIGEVMWQKRLSVPEIALRTPQPNAYNELNPLAFAVEGDLFNDSVYSLGTVRLTIILFDSNNKILAISQRDEFSVQPGERRTYKILWPGIYSTSVAKTMVIPDTNALDGNNLILRGLDTNGNVLDRPKTK